MASQPSSASRWSSPSFAVSTQPTIHSPSKPRLRQAARISSKTFRVAAEPVTPPPLVLGTVEQIAADS